MTFGHYAAVQLATPLPGGERSECARLALTFRVRGAGSQFYYESGDPLTLTLSPSGEREPAASVALP
jgi:hypothetical protein